MFECLSLQHFFFLPVQQGMPSPFTLVFTSTSELIKYRNYSFFVCLFDIFYNSLPQYLTYSSSILLLLLGIQQFNTLFYIIQDRSNILYNYLNKNEHLLEPKVSCIVGVPQGLFTLHPHSSPIAFSCTEWRCTIPSRKYCIQISGALFYSNWVHRQHKQVYLLVCV